MDSEAYARTIEPSLKRLALHEQLSFALSCASRVAHLYRIFDRGDLCVERAVRSVELWVAGECDVEELTALQPKVETAFERSMAAYGSTDNLNSIRNATPAGVVAYQATESARSTEDLLAAAIYSTVSPRDEYMDPTGYCADAAAAALAGTLFSADEAARQSRLLVR